jgi:hypothetical protein
MAADFAAIMNDLEVLRQEKLSERTRRGRFLQPAAWLGVPFFLYAFFVVGQGPMALAGFVVMSFLAWLLYYWGQPEREYAEAYKNNLLPKIAESFGLSYSLRGIMPEKKIRDAGLVPHFTSARAEDFFRGEYQDGHISFFQLTLEETSGSGKNRRTVTVFEGLAVEITLPKKMFYGHTILTSDRSGLSEWLTEKSVGLERAGLVDPVFEERFTVFTNDQVEARYLVDPAMMERILNLHEVHGAYPMSFSCREDSVLILLQSHKNFFEPQELENPVDAAGGEPEKLRQEITGFLSMMDHLRFWKPVVR